MDEKAAAGIVAATDAQKAYIRKVLSTPIPPKKKQYNDLQCALNTQKRNLGWRWRTKLIDKIQRSEMDFTEQLKLIILTLMESRLEGDRERKEKAPAVAAGANNWEKLKAFAQSNHDMTEEHKTALTTFISANHDRSRAKALEAFLNKKKTEPVDMTALHLAAEKGHKTIVEILIQGSFANVINKQTIKHETPLLLAAREGHADVLEKLLIAGADVNQMDKRRQTPLHWAAASGHEAIIEQLLNAGAAMDQADKTGKTPLHWAAKNGHTAIVGRLLRAGADVSTLSSNLISNGAHKALVNHSDPGLAEQLLPIYWQACKNIKNPLKKSLAIAYTGELERFLVANDHAAFIDEERPKDLSKDVTAELKKISDYYEGVKIEGRIERTEWAGSAHDLHPLMEANQTEGLCAGLSMACMLTFLDPKHNELSMAQIIQKNVNKLNPRPGGPAITPAALRIMRLQQNQKIVYDWTSPLLSSDAGEKISLYDNQHSVDEEKKINKLNIEDNKIYYVFLKNEEEGKSSHAMLMGKRKDKYFFWDVNQKLSDDPETWSESFKKHTEYSTEEQMLTKFDAYINEKYTHLTGDHKATLVTKEIIDSLSPMKHREALKKGVRMSPNSCLIAPAAASPDAAPAAPPSPRGGGKA